MRPVLRAALSLAIVSFALGAAAPARAADASAAPSAETRDRFAHKCSGCHGKNGSGPEHPRARVHIPDLRSAAWQAKHDDAAVHAIIAGGVPGKGMPAFKSRLTAEQIDGLVGLLRTFHP